MKPYADRAGQALDMPGEVILAQWRLESASGTSRLAVQQNNFGGIKYSQYSKTAQKVAGTEFARYGSIDAFVTDYIRVMSLSYYKDVRAAGSATDTAIALGKSPYDAGHYEVNGQQGGKILNLLGVKVATTLTDEQRKEIARKAAARIPLTNPTGAAQQYYDSLVAHDDLVPKPTPAAVCPACRRPL